LATYIYQENTQFKTFSREELSTTEHEQCTFENCHFGACNFIGVTFIDCVFTNCVFDEAQLNHVAFRAVKFIRCSMKNLNFAMCDRLLFEVEFDHCRLDFSKFYTLPLHAAKFTNCSVLAVDFMKANLQAVQFDTCDLHRAEFEGALAQKADFYSSENYSINPSKTKLNKAVFAESRLAGLTTHLGLKLS
jgi:uncharacterized protein YjbI with pentapeptide repeats